MKYPITPDGRYFVHRGILWRCTNPGLSPEERERLVKALMQARREVRTAKKSEDVQALRAARKRVNEAKVALGERGPTWWEGDEDLNRKAVKNTRYAQWWESQS